MGLVGLRGRHVWTTCVGDHEARRGRVSWSCPLRAKGSSFAFLAQEGASREWAYNAVIVTSTGGL